MDIWFYLTIAGLMLVAFAFLYSVYCYDKATSPGGWRYEQERRKEKETHSRMH